MDKSIKIIRELAKKYYELSNLDVNHERLILHRSVNDLKAIRPVVLINEMPWNEMNVDGVLDLHCEDEFLRGYEQSLRKSIFQFENFSADMILTPYIKVQKIINSTGIGIGIDEKTISTDDKNRIVSHEYYDQLKTEDDLLKLRDPIFTYNEKITMENYQKISNAIGDILPIKIKGLDGYFVATWDDISKFRGVTPLLLDLMDRPEFTHKMVRRLTDFNISRLNQLEQIGAFDNNPDTIHCTPSANSTLKPNEEYGNVTRKNIWGRGAAQILASVSKQMRDEFDIDYMIETVGECGLVYYGCCEPLDTMIDIVERIPNLRKIGVTPWANAEIAAEAINTKYVFSSKPNPANVSSRSLNEDVIKQELSTILSACKKNNCNVDITLKDISTINYNLDNLVKWEKIVMEMVKSY